jgi:hypothetical protein
MPLEPIDPAHAQQIQAGIQGRLRGHEFENALAATINQLKYPLEIPLERGHVHTGNPAKLLLGYVAKHLKLPRLRTAAAIAAGGLATAEKKLAPVSLGGTAITRCKSDLLLTLQGDAAPLTVGVSIKQCNNSSPTNAQLFFTTTNGFTNLLLNNRIPVSPQAIHELRRFCGEASHRPQDIPAALTGRKIDPRRFFWEELDPSILTEWRRTFQHHQDDITRLLLQKAYSNDPLPPDYVLHKTKKAPSWDATEVALYGVDELVTLSRNYQPFTTKSYIIRKGSYKDPEGVSHEAPRFGIVQMQRGGQKQHPEQLQFNLEAGYFYKIDPEAAAD